MISGKSTRMNSSWFCVRVKPQGVQRPRAGYSGECPCPTAFPGVRTVTVKLI